MENLTEQIEQKEAELTELQRQYNGQKEAEKTEVLKSEGFNKVMYLLGQEFESSCSRTPQYLEFHRVFRRELTKLLKPHTTDILIHKPNHFDVSGFFKLNNGQIYYFSISDLRWSKDQLLIRTATDFKDYTGGSNNSISLDKDFEVRLIEFITA